MNFYGIDAHSDNFKIAMLGLEKEEKVVFSTLQNDKSKIVNFTSKLNKDDFIAIEASTNSFWFYDLVEKHVNRCYVINPHKFADIKNSFVKTDKNDSLKLAKHLKYNVLFGSPNDKLPDVYVPKIEVRDLRALFTTYDNHIRKKTMIKNRVHSLLKQQGMCLNKNNEDIFSEKYDLLSKLKVRDAIKFQIELLVNEIIFIEKSTEAIKNKILEKGVIFRKEIDILTSIKGISVFTAIAIMTDIADINRFESAKKLCAYLGLCPTIDSSNKSTKMGGINRQSRKLTRTILCQSVIHFYNASSYYREYSKNLKSRKSAGKVRIAVIRKIVTNIFRMLKDSKYFLEMDKKNHDNKNIQYLKFLKNIA